MAGGKFGGPPPVADGAHPAFVGSAFFTLQAASPAHGVRAIVGEVEDDGVLFQLVLGQLLEDAAHIAILVFHHGEGAAGLVRVFLLRFGGLLGERKIFEALPIRLRHAPWGVGGGEGNVAKERFLVVPPDEAEGAVGADIHEVSPGPDHAAIFFEGSIEVFAPVAGGIAEELIKTACGRMVGPLAAVMPFSKGPGGVSGGLKGIREGFFCEVQPFPARGDAAHTAARVVASGEHFGTGRGADRANEKVLKGYSGAGNAINVWRTDLGVAGVAEVSPAGIIGKENHHIGTPRRGVRFQAKKCGQPNRQEAEKTCHGMPWGQGGTLQASIR